HACLTHLPARLFPKFYNTSGASDTILINWASRNSRATGPNIRVPRGLLSSRIMTAAFSSNRMYDPSLRRVPDLDLTITALTISPFLTTPPGVACFTEQTTTSPMLADLRPDPPSIFIVL